MKYHVCFLQGVGGAVQYPKNYLKEAYKLVRERGGICIADEVRAILNLDFLPSSTGPQIIPFYREPSYRLFLQPRR